MQNAFQYTTAITPNQQSLITKSSPVSPLIGIIEERPKTNNLASDYNNTKCEKLHAIFLQPLNSSHWHKSHIIAAEQP